jgi:outer membrane protein OmpA-like peptidoglycan-associated protein
MRRSITLGVLMPAVALVLTGCATKDWVRETLGKKEAEINQRVGGVETRVVDVEARVDNEARRIGTVEGLVTEGSGRITALESSLGQAAETARQAHSRAEAAHARADEVDSRLTRLWSNRNKRNTVETIHLQFGFDRADLSDAAQTALLAVVKELKDNPNLTVELQGYADPTGPRDYNVALSQRRVEAVRRYLIDKGTELPRITSVGLGALTDKGEDNAKKRRVTLKLMVQAD